LKLCRLRDRNCLAPRQTQTKIPEVQTMRRKNYGAYNVGHQVKKYEGSNLAYPVTFDIVFLLALPDIVFNNGRSGQKKNDVTPKSRTCKEDRCDIV